MEDYSEGKSKKNGIKAHKAAQERKGDWRGKTTAPRDGKTQKEKSVLPEGKIPGR